ncbi:MAG: ATP-dependent DNA helicase RecG, partial [Nocardioidaceae bacterium]
MSTDARRLAATIGWDARLATVAGKHATKIEKAFGYRTVGDLLQHYPRRWVDKGSLSELGELEPDEHVTVIARVVEARQHQYADRRRGGVAYRLEVVVATDGDQVVLTFFDKAKHQADWRQRQLLRGRIGLFSGKVGSFRGRTQLVNPQTQMFGGEDGDAEAVAEWARIPQLVTIYPATAAVQSWQLAEAVRVALDLVDEVPELLPEQVRRDHGFVSARAALVGLHRPETWEQQREAARRLRFDEAFVTQTVLAQR